MEFVLIVGWLACGLIAASIGQRKGEGCGAFIVGVLLGPLGILLALVSKGNRKTCPFCKELIHKDAVVCPRCQRDLIKG
jgi:hypothetical protein